MDNHFILLPYFLDQPMPGLEPLIEPGWEVLNPQLKSEGRQARMGELYDRLADTVSDSLRRGERPVCLAGDCCASLGVLAGLQRAGFDPSLIWFDAHGDFNTWGTTPSGFLGGMPLAMLVGRGEQTIVDALRMTPISEDRAILSDGRDLDPGEREALESSGVKHYRDVAALTGADLPNKSLWVHFDTDVVDAKESPAMNYPVSNGPDVTELRKVFQNISKTGRIAAVSLSAWDPTLPGAETSRAVSMSLLGELINPHP